VLLTWYVSACVSTYIFICVINLVFSFAVEAGLSPWILHQGGRDLQLPEPCVHMRLAVFNNQVSE